MKHSYSLGVFVLLLQPEMLRQYIVAVIVGVLLAGGAVGIPLAEFYPFGNSTVTTFSLQGLNADGAIRIVDLKLFGSDLGLFRVSHAHCFHVCQFPVLCVSTCMPLVNNITHP